MADVILAVLGRRETAAGVLDAAQHLAARLGGASIVVLAVDARPSADPRAAAAPAAAAAASPNGGSGRIASLRTMFDAWAGGAGQAGGTVQWNAVEADAADIVERRGRRADFLVIARPRGDDDAPTRHAFRVALLHTERPVLVVPSAKSGQFGHCVAIAWRDDGRAVKAVIPALRFLGGARQVHLLTGVRAGASVPGVPAVLQDHGISAIQHILPIGPRVFGKALLEALHELGADMLVMGAYAHSPLHEMIFGGATRYMLEHADVPVLMRH